MGDLRANDDVCCRAVGVEDFMLGGAPFGGVGIRADGDPVALLSAPASPPSPCFEALNEPPGEVRRELPGVPRERGVRHWLSLVLSFELALLSPIFAAAAFAGMVIGDGRNALCGSAVGDAGVGDVVVGGVDAARGAVAAAAAASCSGRTTTR
jgi:hypothetical protein